MNPSKPITSHLKIAIAQGNPTVGDLAGNIAKAQAIHAEASRIGADLVVLSELFITGYPPEDLVKKPAFVEASRAATERLAASLPNDGPGMLIGTVWPEDGKVYNAVALIDGMAESKQSDSKWICRTTACSTKSAYSMRARFLVRSTSAACGSACRSARTSGQARSQSA